MRISKKFEIKILRSRSRTYVNLELQPNMSEVELILQKKIIQKLR